MNLEYVIDGNLARCEVNRAAMAEAEVIFAGHVVELGVKQPCYE